MPYKTLLLSVSDGVATIALNRPDRLNALTTDSYIELREALVELFGKGEVRALVVTGAGRAFCAGADMKADHIDPKDPDHLIRDLALPAYSLLREAPVPTIAAVNGPCVGAGVGLALVCDVVVAARSAYFVQAFVKLGLVPDFGSSWFLAHRIGEARAAALLMTGDKLAAAKAEEWGLIYKCVEDSNLMEEAGALAKKFAQGPSKSYLMIRELNRMAWKNDLPAQLDLERKYLAIARNTEDAREAVKAFREKRSPVFKGR